MDDEFNPDRFEGNEDLIDETFDFAFGFGERKCLAKNIIHLEIKSILIQILKKFKLTINEEEKKKKLEILSEGFMMKIKNDEIKINFDEI